MNFLKLFIGLVLTSVLIVFSTAPFSACTKTKTEIIHDTTTVIRRDTVVVIDSIYDVDSGLLAYYNFENGSLNDRSGFGNNITFSSATPTMDRFGNANGAYLFNGTDNYMQVPNSISLNPPGSMTLMAIFKVNGFYPGVCHANQIFGKGSPDNIDGLYVMRFNDFSVDCNSPANYNNEIFNAGTNTLGLVTDTVFVKTGQWYTLIYTYNGIVANMYLNGQLKSSVTASAGFVPNTHDLFIGRDEDATYPYFFNGVIDEIRIYNRALPLGAIERLSR